MDFVVVGLGLGACAVLAGVVLLGWSLPRAERAAAAAAAGASETARAEAAAAATRGAGQVMLSTGGAIFLATIGALAGSLDDRTGAFLVVTTVTVAALGILVWGYRNRNRISWLAPRRRPRPLPAAPVEPLTVLPPGFVAPPPEPNGAHEPFAADHVDDDLDFDEADPGPEPVAAGEAVAVPPPDPDPDPDGDDDSRERVAVGGAAPEAGRDD